MPVTIRCIAADLETDLSPENRETLWSQCVGYEGVDKRIDQIAGLIKRGGTVYDLMETEHAYAPPFSSAKDPIAIAGYVASNIISGAMPVISWRELAGKKDGIMLIDTRTPEEFSFGTIPGAVNIPLDEMRGRLSEIPEDKPVVLFCAVGLRGYLAQRILMGHGYRNTANLIGGYKTYSAAVAPVPAPVPPAEVLPAEVSSATSASPQSVQGVSAKEPLKINACGLQCPGPIMQVKKAMDSISPGERVEIVATDAGFARDASAWCATTGNKLVEKKEEKGRYTVLLEKGDETCACPSSLPAAGGRGKTLILFSDDLDKALATFVLANGAAATGQKFRYFSPLGAERIEEDTETSDAERCFRKNVWHDAPVQLFETETVQNEYDGDGQPDDALPHETERNRFFGVVTFSGVGARR